MNYLTLQEIYDKVKKHLLEQNVRSMWNSSECAYRGQNGTKCAAGCLIKDEYYHPSFESKNALETNVAASLANSGVDMFNEADRSLVTSLQNIHDFELPINWENLLIELAKNYKLTP